MSSLKNVNTLIYKYDFECILIILIILKTAVKEVKQITCDSFGNGPKQ